MNLLATKNVKKNVHLFFLGVLYGLETFVYSFTIPLLASQHGKDLMI